MGRARRRIGCGIPQPPPPAPPAAAPAAPALLRRTSPWAPRRLALAAAAGLAVAGPTAARAKHVEGRVRLAAKQARVVTKFCFDFSKECSSDHCPGNVPPGMLTVDIFDGQRFDGGGGTTTAGPAGHRGKAADPEVYLAMLDDEYFSFPEVSQVWGEANCTEVRRASKKSFRLDWRVVAAARPGAGRSAPETVKTRVVERLRPRWWYIAFVSCSAYEVDLSYRMHLENPLRGSERELSMDAVGVLWASLLLSGLFGWLLARQLGSLRAWAAGAGGSLEEWKGKPRRWFRLHPAVLLLTAATALAAAGEGMWLLHFWVWQAGGALGDLSATLARVALAAGRTMLSILLMLLATGQIVCTPDIAWDDHREIVGGLVLFGVLSFGLESWGESEFRTSTTEYIYDTRPGSAAVALDLLWLYIYVTRSWQTWQAETRVKPRMFYRRFGAPLALWFAALPILALLAAQLSAWVRYKIVFALGGLTHAAALGVLVHTFQPSMACELYELSTHEYESVNGEELDSLFQDDDMI